MSKKIIINVHEEMNEECASIVNTILNDIENGFIKYVGRLRTCNARVYENEDFYLLKSYETFVAAINKQTYTLYDFSRYVYGYTATTSQHISKFNKDFSEHGYGCKRVVTYRPI